MLRRIAVIIAAAILWCGPLAAQAPGAGKAAAGGETPARTAALETTAPVDREPGVQRDRVEQAAKDSIRSLDLQTELVIDNSKPFRLSPLGIPQWVLWVALVLAVGLLLYAMREQLMNLIRPANSGWEPPPPGGGEVEIGSETDALAAADRLSREGNFVEAMHVLLLHSLSEIRRQLGEQFADSLTSREILRVARLTAVARTALRDIVGAVERTYFGAYPAQPGDYAACRQNFATLQQALRGGAPA
jgi:uncharacterized protein DUF4129